MRSAQCPNCNAQLSFDDTNRDFCFCQYCGTKIILDDYRSSHRIIDEARIREVEANKLLQLKKMELYEKKRKTSMFFMVIIIIISIALIIAAIAMFLIDNLLEAVMILTVIPWLWIIYDSNRDKEFDFGDKISVPSGINGYSKKTYTDIQLLFENAGFTNVQCEPLEDIIAGWVYKPNTVSSITINGEVVTVGGKRYSPDASIIIYYHSHLNKSFN